jgi:hypothetical protein
MKAEQGSRIQAVTWFEGEPWFLIDRTTAGCPSLEDLGSWTDADAYVGDAIIDADVLPLNAILGDDELRRGLGAMLSEQFPGLDPDDLLAAEERMLARLAAESDQLVAHVAPGSQEERE